MDEFSGFYVTTGRCDTSQGVAGRERGIIILVIPASAEQKLSLADFHARYDGEKPYFEYWDDETVQKSSPTRLHSLLEQILVELLDGLGYDACFEITIKLDRSFELVPDAIAVEGD